MTDDATNQNTTPLTVAEHLAPYKGRPVYLFEFVGNNGDRLITLGAETLIEQAGARQVGSPADAEHILFTGGARTDHWPIGFEQIRQLVQDYPQTPVTLLPSTIRFEGRLLPEMLEGRDAPATIFARERPTFERMKPLEWPAQTRLSLDHDMAFALADGPMVHRLQAKARDRHVLIVERADNERITQHTTQTFGPSWKRHVPNALKLPLKRRLIEKQARATPMAQSIGRWLDAEQPAWAKLPLVVQDTSRDDLYSFDRFCATIADSAAVFSTRLHVCILAAMLGKETYIIAGGGSLQKITGIRDYSMAEMTHVHQWDLPSGRPL